jgi:hypothetical protein
MQHTSLNHDKRAQITYLQKPKRTSSWRIIKNKGISRKTKAMVPVLDMPEGGERGKEEQGCTRDLQKVMFSWWGTVSRVLD